MAGKAANTASILFGLGLLSATAVVAYTVWSAQKSAEKATERARATIDVLQTPAKMVAETVERKAATEATQRAGSSVARRAKRKGADEDSSSGLATRSAHWRYLVQCRRAA